MDTLRRMMAGLLLLIIFMSRSALTVDGMDPHRIFSDPTLDPKSNYSKVTCDFAKDTCGWDNVGGDDYPLTWHRRRSSYMRLKMKGAGNRKGRLASPWLRPLSFHSCRLRFQYYIPTLRLEKCRLSLYRQSRSGEEQRLWSTQKGTGFWVFSHFIDQDVNCTAGTFRMVFEGWKDCGWWAYDEIDVKSIKFTVYPDHSPPDPTPSGVDTIEHVPTVIIVTVVVIVGVLIIVIVIVRRRRQRRQKDQKDPLSQHKSGTTTNPTHGLELLHTAGNGGTDSRGHHRKPAPRGDPPSPAVVSDNTYNHTSRTRVQEHLYSSLY